MSTSMSNRQISTASSLEMRVVNKSFKLCDLRSKTCSEGQDLLKFWNQYILPPKEEFKSETFSLCLGIRSTSPGNYSSFLRRAMTMFVCLMLHFYYHSTAWNSTSRSLLFILRGLCLCSIVKKKKKNHLFCSIIFFTVTFLTHFF